MRISVFVFLICLSLHVFSAQEQYSFNTEEQELAFKELTQELRCPKCQNQNIADSDALVAKDLRAKVLSLVNEGKSKDQVIDYMIDRYGYFVHYQPPVTPATIVLWVLPVLIVIIGFGFIVFRQKKASKKQKWNAQDEEKLAQLIKQYQRQEHNS